MTKLGIAFAGGGVRGASHLGIIQALEENGIKADMYAGTSAGSLVASLLANGVEPKDALTHFETACKHLLDVAYGHILKGIFTSAKIEGFVKGDKLESIMDNLLGGKKVKDLPMPVSFVTTDINQSSEVIFTNMKNLESKFIHCRRVSIIEDPEYKTSAIVRASSSIPPIFIPKEIDGHKLVDGGVVNNLPSDVVWAMGADKVISLDLGYYGDVTTGGFIDISHQCLNDFMNRVVDNNMDEFGLYLDPQIHNVTVLETSKIQYCYDQGYQFGCANISKIKEYLEG